MHDAGLRRARDHPGRGRQVDVCPPRHRAGQQPGEHGDDAGACFRKRREAHLGKGRVIGGFGRANDPLRAEARRVLSLKLEFRM